MFIYACIIYNNNNVITLVVLFASILLICDAIPI